jgi:run domain Beclin-1 interacting cysteine-rich containing protein
MKIPEGIFQPFIRESIVITDYDKQDSRRSLYQIAQSRAGTSAQSAKSTSAPSLVATSTEPQPKHRAPDGWVSAAKQLHFYIQSKGTVKGQGSVCFGCQTAISEGFFSAPRYCEYTGKFYCQRCHSGKKYYIPARIVHNWDFSMQPVNNGSLEFLTALYEEPSCDIGVLNPKLYKTVPVLKDLRLVRKKLYHMKDFIMTCTKLTDEDPPKALLKTCPSHHYTSVEMYSIADLVKVDVILDKLMGTLEVWFNHIAGCPLCSGKGSFCEICHKDRPIYPFQLLDVIQCKKCSGIFHRTCFKKGFCPKCRRRDTRSIPHVP